MRPSGCSEVTWLPQGSAAIGHRHRQHPAEATTEAAGVIPESQERFVALFVYLHFILVNLYETFNVTPEQAQHFRFVYFTFADIQSVF